MVERLDERFCSRHLPPFLSDVVTVDGQDTPEAVRERYDALLIGEHELVLVQQEVIQLVAAYQRRKILTQKFYCDGLHIALARVAEVDMLRASLRGLQTAGTGKGLRKPNSRREE